MENEDKIEELSRRLNQLASQHSQVQAEIRRISNELDQLRVRRTTVEAVAPPPPLSPPPVVAPTPAPPIPVPRPVAPAPLKKVKTPWEEFIGTNLLNKIGIAVLVLGVGFGAKYSIDNALLDPLTRIILGYCAGIALLVVAFRLREKHTAFSAVLLSGGMTVLYFITFLAYNLYGLIPQAPAFILMFLFTAFTVFAAVRYNMEVIGIIGLVGAYAVPFLLSDGSGRVVILFSYIAIINAGILVLAFKKYWKRLFYAAFVFTWLSFVSWFFAAFDGKVHTALSLGFSTLYLVTFYTMFLAYKLIRHEALGWIDIVCMVLNSFIYFGVGYVTVMEMPGGDDLLGLFTVLTAALHFVAVAIIYRMQRSQSDLLYFVGGMVLVFLTVAVPVQLDGNWVTIVWASEALLLFWIGRSRNYPAYERLCYPLVALAFFSLLHDWSDAYTTYRYYYLEESERSFTIFLNVNFLTSMLVGAAFGVMSYLDRKTTPTLSGVQQRLIGYVVPILAMFVIYSGFYKEIEAFWDHKYLLSRVTVPLADGETYDEYNNSMMNFQRIWLIIFSCIFGYVLYFLTTKVRSQFLQAGVAIYSAIVLFAFVASALVDLGDLRDSYLTQENANLYARSLWHVLIRYVAVASALPLIWIIRRQLKDSLFDVRIRKGADLYLHVIVLSLLSSELIHWLDMAGVANAFRLSLSLLWGAYALLMIVVGLMRDIRHIRIGGIALFAVTLIKLFAYDMMDMSMILKTVVMIGLGVLLLVASFIYTKHKRPARDEVQP